VTTENHSNVRRKFDFKKAVNNGELDSLLEEQLEHGSRLNRKRYNIRVVWSFLKISTL